MEGERDWQAASWFAIALLLLLALGCGLLGNIGGVLWSLGGAVMVDMVRSGAA